MSLDWLPETLGKLEDEKDALRSSWTTLQVNYELRLRDLQKIDEDRISLANQLREARELLAALVASTPLYDPMAHYLGCCGSPFYNAHKRDCPWLLAKQYLEPNSQQPFRASESRQEPRN